MGIIYMWENKVNGKVYIGQTINPDQRKRNHLHEALVKSSDYYFHRALRKHGADNFEYTVLEDEVEREHLNEREDFFIGYYNSIWPNGYNQCHANSLDIVAIEKMANTKRQQWLDLPKEEKERRIAYLKTIHSGMKQTELQKRKAREANQKQWLVTFPDGHTENVVNLRQFCLEQGLGTTGQSNLVRGKYKGYKAQKTTF